MSMLEADNLTAICELPIYTMWRPQNLKIEKASTAFDGVALLCLGRYVRTSQETQVWASTTCHGDSFTVFM
jgi:hypothetical protein